MFDGRTDGGVLVILQNAYGVPADYMPSYGLEVFVKSHTGKRLSEALPVGWPVAIINASPEIGDSPDSRFPPDVEHIKRSLIRYKPKVVLAAGKAAQEGVAGIFDGPVVEMPHPAYRALSKAMTAQVKERLAELLLKGDVDGRNIARS